MGRHPTANSGEESGLSRLLRCRRPLIGMVHLPPLPGSPHAQPMSAVLRRARRDTEIWFEQGVDAVLVENFGDSPFFPDRVPAETVVAMTAALQVVRSSARGPVGVNVLRNDAATALAMAGVLDLDFVRVNVLASAAVADQGILVGRAHEWLRLRDRLPGCPAILADVQVKHARSLASRPILEEAIDLVERDGADAVLVTGERTGAAGSAEDAVTLAERLKAPVLLASGVTPDTIRETRDKVFGWIVGTFAKVGGKTDAPPSPARIQRLLQARAAR